MQWVRKHAITSKATIANTPPTDSIHETLAEVSFLSVFFSLPFRFFFFHFDSRLFSIWLIYIINVCLVIVVVIFCSIFAISREKKNRATFDFLIPRTHQNHSIHMIILN